VWHVTYRPIPGARFANAISKGQVAQAGFATKKGECDITFKFRKKTNSKFCAMPARL